MLSKDIFKSLFNIFTMDLLNMFKSFWRNCSMGLYIVFSNDFSYNKKKSLVNSIFYNLPGMIGSRSSSKDRFFNGPFRSLSKGCSVNLAKHSSEETSRNLFVISKLMFPAFVTENSNLMNCSKDAPENAFKDISNSSSRGFSRNCVKYWCLNASRSCFKVVCDLFLIPSKNSSGIS